MRRNDLWILGVKGLKMKWGKLNVIAGLLTRFTPPTIILLSTALSFSWSRMCSILQKKNLKWIESVTNLTAFQILRWIIHAFWLVLPWFFHKIYCRADTWIISPLTTLCLKLNTTNQFSVVVGLFINNHRRSQNVAKRISVTDSAKLHMPPFCSHHIL